jgi:hypothetical protein
MAKSTTDHDDILRWAKKHHAKPAAVKRTHSDDSVGIIRLMFPDAPQSKHEELEEISWDEFFEQFDERGLVLLYEEDSNFNKLVSQETAHQRDKREGASSQRGH